MSLKDSLKDIMCAFAEIYAILAPINWAAVEAMMEEFLREKGLLDEFDKWAKENDIKISLEVLKEYKEMIEGMIKELEKMAKEEKKEEGGR